MHIQIIQSSTIAAAQAVAHQIAQFLTTKGIKASIISEKDHATGDLLISLGGDGSMLLNTQQVGLLSKPILGVNLGHLGFMADVPIDDLIPSLELLAAGKFSIDHRLVLEVELPHIGMRYAINDVVIHRSHEISLIELSLFSDQQLINTFLADGMVIATPNGSTAYSLAAGGPIVTPDLDAVVITPICPHTISNRPIVVNSNKTLRIVYEGNKEGIEIVVDGLYRAPLASRHTISISKSTKTFAIVNLHKRDYFSTLRTKLNWSGKLRHGQ